MCTRPLATIKIGFYDGNLSKVVFETYLEEYPEKTSIITSINEVCKRILSLRLKSDSFWYKARNMFILIISLYNHKAVLDNINNETLKNALLSFEREISEDYIMDGDDLKSKKSRIKRYTYISSMIEEIIRE